MICRKTIKCELVNPTGKKLDLLNQEWAKYQDFIRLENMGLDWVADKIPIHSVYKTQARWYWKKYKKQDFPMSLNNQVLKIAESKNKLSEYWARIPVKGKYGGIWVAIKPHKPFPDGCKLGESKLFKQKGRFHLHIVIKKEIEIRQTYDNVISVDMGEKRIATVLHNGKPIFMGKEVRGIRRHYAYLRKTLGKKKLPKIIKQTGQRESNKVNQILHDISNEIVSMAKETPNSAIAIGNLKGIRKSANKKGKRMKRIVNNMPFYKLTFFITYKANWEGIPVIKINEVWTSKTCPKCKSIGERVNQGLFRCLSCGYQANADYVGATNIRDRALGYMPEVRAVLQPKSIQEVQA
jgi:putative transposase